MSCTCHRRLKYCATPELVGELPLNTDGSALFGPKVPQAKAATGLAANWAVTAVLSVTFPWGPQLRTLVRAQYCRRAAETCCYIEERESTSNAIFQDLGFLFAVSAYVAAMASDGLLIAAKAGLCHGMKHTCQAAVHP